MCAADNTSSQHVTTHIRCAKYAKQSKTESGENSSLRINKDGSSASGTWKVSKDEMQKIMFDPKTSKKTTKYTTSILTPTQLDQGLLDLNAQSSYEESIGDR